ncbi:Dna2/Cas4 domain-containing protein [Halorubrum halodurans]|uniref:Dna2/Cas4 domain-containing protein n=2 Tax=Halorubrum halodurans TaxID=1383851 RepID=A0A256IJK2_9EURY|nr:Dna2/Cas4 domain-containing protein [Halorubrum halodurans]
MAHGILWVGSRFEEDVVLPYLRDTVADDGLFVTNSLYVDFELKSESGDLTVKGSTDPVVVDADGTPVLPTEVKTKSSLEYLDEPNEHHKAQLHAYMVGLSEKYDVNVKRGCLIYGGRDAFDLKVFDVEFDEAFWQSTVVEWASDHTAYRLDSELPPADSRFAWECDFCDYRERCGKGEIKCQDSASHGLLPEFEEYPRQPLLEYLDAHDAKLTPTLAQRYPNLCEKYEVYDWSCNQCGTRIEWESSHLSGDGDRLCPTCADDDRLVVLSDPDLKEQTANGAR